MICRRPRVRRGSAACRRCRMSLPMKASSTSSRSKPAQTRWNSACGISQRSACGRIDQGDRRNRAGWEHRAGPKPQDPDADIVRGRGIAQARDGLHGNWPGVGAAWSAWVAEVAVNPRPTGEVNVTRVVVGQDTGMMINPAGVRHQLHGNIVQSTSRVLKEEVPLQRDDSGGSRATGALIRS